jgi:GNAT superfamily N-acetyltransferase
MRDLVVRPVAGFDTGAMARLLNQIIAFGGTTAMTDPVTAEDIAGWAQAPRSAWHVAEQAGEIVGFQWVEPWGALPPEAAAIATFAAQGRTGLGIGSALFAATEPAARSLGYAWINAEIRADNVGGLAYYQSRGFRVWKHVRDVEIAPALVVDKVWKRYDLD